MTVAPFRLLGLKLDLVLVALTLLVDGVRSVGAVMLPVIPQLVLLTIRLLRLRTMPPVLDTHRLVLHTVLHRLPTVQLLLLTARQVPLILLPVLPIRLRALRIVPLHRRIRQLVLRIALPALPIRLPHQPTVPLVRRILRPVLLTVPRLLLIVQLVLPIVQHHLLTVLRALRTAPPHQRIVPRHQRTAHRPRLTLQDLLLTLQDLQVIIHLPLVVPLTIPVLHLQLTNQLLRSPLLVAMERLSRQIHGSAKY